MKKVVFVLFVIVGMSTSIYAQHMATDAFSDGVNYGGGFAISNDKIGGEIYAMNTGMVGFSFDVYQEHSLTSILAATNINRNSYFKDSEQTNTSTDINFYDRPVFNAGIREMVETIPHLYVGCELGLREEKWGHTHEEGLNSENIQKEVNVVDETNFNKYINLRMSFVAHHVIPYVQYSITDKAFSAGFNVVIK